MAIDWNSVFAKTKAMEKTIRKTKGTAQYKPSPVSDSPLLAPVKRAQASTYLTGDTPTPATPYAAGPQAGIVKAPERTTKPKTEKPTQEAEAPAWMGLLGQSAAELEQRHKTAMAERDALSKQVEREETPTPNSTYAASAGRYKPKEANPISGAAAASGGWVSQEDKLLAPLRMAVSRKQDEVNDLAAAHYHRKNQEQFAKLETDAAAKISYTTAKELTADLDTLAKALNNPSAYNGHDTRFNAAGEELAKKYGTYDLQTLQRTLTAQKAKLVADLAAKGYDFETMAGYDRMLAQQETYAKTQEKWQKDAEKHPVASSGLSVFLSPLQGFDAVRTWGNGVGHSNADDLGSYVPADVYDMYATNAVQAIRGTVSKQIEENTDWELFGQNVASFLYNTGMSMADSALQVSTLGSGATFVMGLSSAANTTKEIIERGGSNEQAFWGGLAAGTAEMVFEKFSVESILNLDFGDGWKDAIKALFAQGGVEASEEMLTEVANILSDAMVMGDRSGLAASIRAYEEQGLTRQEAGLRATLDSIGQVSLAGAAGFLSGIGMAGGKLAFQKGGNAVYDHFTRRQKSQTAENVTGTGVDSRLGSDVTVDTPAAQNPVEGAKNAPTEGARNEAGLVAISEREQTQLATGKRNIIASTVKDIVDFAKSALAKKGGQERLYMGVIPDSTAQMVLEQTGFDVTGYKAILTGDAVQHTRNRHGDPIREQARGQRVVTADDYGMIPQVLANPDSVELTDGRDSSGRRVILFSKQIGDVYVTAQAVTDSRHAITTDTMWIQKRKGYQDTTPDAGSYATDPVHNVQNAPSESPSTDSIPQTAQDVNPETGVNTRTAQSPAEGEKNAPVEGAERVYHGQVLDTVRGHLNEVQNMAAVARLTGSEFQKQAGDTRPLRTKVMEFFNSLGNKVTRPDIGDIALTGAGARDSTAHGYGKLKAATFAALPSVLKDGKIIEVRGPYGGHSYDSIFISAPVEVDGATHYVGALVIKDTNMQRYKLHEVLTTNESGTPLFKSETTGNADGPLRSDAPLGTSGDVPTMDSIPQTAQDVNPETGDGMPNSVGAAARRFTTPDAPNETRVSRQAETTLSYNDQRGAAASMTRGEWNESFRYEVQSREQWEQWAGERLFVERGGERLFIRDFDPAGYQALVEELETAPAWNATMRKTAEMVEQELRRRAAEPDMADTNAVNETEYRAFVNLVADKTRETARGLAAANLWEDGANDRGAATERMAWDTLEKSGLTPEERMERFRAVVKFDQDIERAGTDAEALRGVILDIGRARGVLNNSLTQKESTLLNKLTASALEALDAAELKQFAYASSVAMVGDAQGSDLGAKLKTVQVLNMLSNPKTAMRNLVGNTSFTALDAMTMRGGALLDMALSNLTGTRSIAMESAAFSKESRTAIIKAIKRSIAEITLDVDMGAGNRYTGSGRRTFQANGNMVERVLSVMERNMGYLLTTTDEAYKGAARATQGATQKLIDEGKIKTNDPQYAQKQAEALAKYRTFQNDTVVSAALQSVHDFLNMFGVGDSGKRMFAGKLGDGKKGKVVHAFGAGDLVSPFTRVAANLWTVGVDYSPVNAVKGAAEIVSTIVDRVRTGSVDPAKQAKGVSNATRGLTGTALAYGFMMLASAGFVRRADDEGDEDVAAMNRSEGMTGTQINVSAMQRAMSGGNAQWQEGDTLVDLSSVEPINLVIDMGLEMSKIQESGGGILSTYGGATLNSALHSAQDLPVLQGVSDMGRDVFEYHKNPFIAALEQVGNTAISSVTPNILAAAAKGLDGKQRSTRSSGKDGLGKVGDVLLDTFKSRVPGLRQTLPTTTGPDGKEKENPGGAAQRLINAMLNPVGVNKYTQSDVSREMERVRGETGKTDFYPASKIPYSLSITKDGKTREVKLDYKQRQAFQASRSSTQMATLAGVMGSRRYKAADAQLQAELLKRCYDYSYNRAKMEVLGKDAAPAWVDHAQHSKQELGISTADYFYYYETLGSEIMSGSGYEKTKRMVKAGVSLEAWGKMKPSLDADDSGSVNKAELTAYIEAHFPKGKWRQIFDAYNGNGSWKNPY